MTVLVAYRYFVDAGILLAREQSAGVFSSASRTGVVCPHKNGKKAVFPASTKYRYLLNTSDESG